MPQNAECLKIIRKIAKVGPDAPLDTIADIKNILLNPKCKKDYLMHLMMVQDSVDLDADKKHIPQKKGTKNDVLNNLETNNLVTYATLATQLPKTLPLKLMFLQTKKLSQESQILELVCGNQMEISNGRHSRTLHLYLLRLVSILRTPLRTGRSSSAQN
jgi:hypothetical protein